MTSNKKIIGDFCYYYKNRLGDGLSSEVYRGINQKTNQQVAIKIIPKVQHCKDQNIWMAATEVKILQEMSGVQNIVQFYFSAQTRNNIYIVTQLCEKGSLADVIKKHGKLSEEQSLKYLSQIINGYKSIGQRSYVHRDIKPQNIFITAGDVLVIGDFGLCVRSDQEISHHEEAGSLFYMAPQIIFFKENYSSNRYSQKSDIWAIGITFLQMIAGRAPWKSRKQDLLKREIRDFDVDSALPACLSEKSRIFLKRALCVDPNQRMSLKELLSYNEIEPNTKIEVCLPLKENKGSKSNEVEDDDKKPVQFNRQQLRNNHLNLEQIKACDSGSKNKLVSKKAKENGGEKNQDLLSFEQHMNRLTFKQAKLSNQPVLKKSRRNSCQVDQKQLKVNERRKREGKQSEYVTQQNQENKMCDVDSKRLKTKPSNQKSLQQLLADLDHPENQQKWASQADHNKIVIERIVSQVQGNINYFRLIFKIVRRMNRILKTDDDGIRSFIAHLFHMFVSSLDEVRQLSNLKEFSQIQLERFKKNAHYTRLVSLIQHYRERGVSERQKFNVSAEFKGENEFMKLLSYVMNILFENVVAVEKSEQQLNRKKQLVFILEGLITLAKISLNKGQAWSKINETLNLSEKLEQKSSSRIDEEYWRAIKSNFTKLFRQSSGF